MDVQRYIKFHSHHEKIYFSDCPYITKGNDLATMSLRPHILYLDDEENNLFAFKSVFRRSYNIITASVDSEAIQVLEREKADLVLSGRLS